MRTFAVLHVDRKEHRLLTLRPLNGRNEHHCQSFSRRTTAAVAQEVRRGKLRGIHGRAADRTVKLSGHVSVEALQLMCYELHVKL